MILVVLAAGIMSWLTLSLLSDWYWLYMLRRLQRQDRACQRCAGSGRIWRSSWQPAPRWTIWSRTERCPACDGDRRQRPPQHVSVCNEDWI